MIAKVNGTIAITVKMTITASTAAYCPDEA
jgi:hypothetical protein